MTNAVGRQHQIHEEKICNGTCKSIRGAKSPSFLGQHEMVILQDANKPKKDANCDENIEKLLRNKVLCFSITLLQPQILFHRLLPTTG